MDGKPTITSSKLTVSAEVPGLDREAFERHTLAAKTDCPVAKALTGTEVTLEAELVRRAMGTTDRPGAKWTMNELLKAYPGAAEVLTEHGVDPRTHCNHTVRNCLRQGQVLGRDCPVDNVKETLADLEALVST